MHAARTPHHGHTTGPAWHFSDLNVPLTLAALAAVALWLLAVLAARTATRPRMPRPGPKTMDLRPEPPAVAEFLTGGWEVGGSAVQATLVDLAGRGLLGFEQVGPDPRDTIVRVKGEAGGGGGFGQYGSAPVSSFGQYGSAPGSGFGQYGSAPGSSLGQAGAAPGSSLGPTGGFGQSSSVPGSGFGQGSSPGSTGSAPNSGLGSTIPAAARMYGVAASEGLAAPFAVTGHGPGSATGGSASEATPTVAGRPVHVPARGNPGPLLPFEKRVLHRVSVLARDGVVPARALAQGTKDQDAKWHKAFDREVVADARARGLSRARYGFGIKALLAVAALVPAVLAAAAATRSRANGDGDGGAFAVVMAGALIVLGTLTGERETKAGQEVCAEWLGVRDWLAADEQFRRLPPAAVAIWDRYLAFAAGFGIARKTIGALPLGARDERRAWSTYGGVWHEVRLGYLAATERRVRHPKQSVRIAVRRIAACLVLAPGLVWIAVHKHWMVRLPLGHGTDVKAFTALGIAVACVIVSVSLYNVGGRVSKGKVVGIAFYILAPGALLWYVSHGLKLTDYEVSHTYVSYGVIAVSTLLSLVTAWNVVLLFGALADLALREQIVGELVRIRDRSDDRHLAVDPGGVAKIHAWPVARDAFGSLSEGATVSVTRGKWFGYVYDVSVTAASARGDLFAEAV
ncbi:nucleoporin [Catenulispora subtropica]|uniref:Predicted membrane protein YciQ-like C-terminal domain-containing protein n=1 Tax=Catenulispora subtropica TaxID=450798 RepID=A0ABP5CYN8_9ACTN